MPKTRPNNPRSAATPERRSQRDRRAGGKAARAMQKRGMSTNTKLTLGLLAVVLIGLTALFVVVQRQSGKAGQVSAERLVRADSHRISTAGDSRVTVVEFLDFECPACGQAFPQVERLRTEYAGRITYVVRNFPLSVHANAENAARAAEAAGKQDKFEQMYVKLFQTQSSWGNQQQDQSAVFAGYAEQLGLDMTRYRADVSDASTADRIRQDQQDGTAAGVQSTPTFFLNGERFDGPATYAALKNAVDAALSE
ncbi:thioredoxin domain-containing protein [Micromonospora sp. WMMD975]|uniref:DsbA family protein n=1 Tax=Micromonospora sp. WMMD975 TaxID=3016087 RepID=UPI00249A2B62|nr:thioredoxin domain-containing protein [Micromonospora sp. WMMD975]WFE30928.1 thioredoxin domain-containing protein [Micromonospora sp. WMMD975]